MKTNRNGNRDDSLHFGSHASRVIMIYLNRDRPWSGNPSSHYQWWHVTFDETNALKWGWNKKMCNGQYLLPFRRLGLGVSFPFCVEKWWSQNKVCTVIIRRMFATTKQQAFWGFICPSAGSTLSILYRSDVDFVVGWGGWKTWSKDSCGSAKHHWAHLAHSCFGLVWIHAIAVPFSIDEQCVWEYVFWKKK